ncbi:hypothetical protein [Rhizobium sp. MHM7A]|uniref:hypothetical protein n=1 Tax=Rhizobium sp. MHM7A TaxID=2583233 RepID=UPI001105E4FF|nr:hypothetical protein [Rhizobium sp. MHM7A]TLX16549.1 hypothetical protein FFR93_04215 [Rhizobium sp. MHM7A]
MRIALICEKPSLAKRVIDELLFIEPDMDRSAFVVGWANEFYHLNSAFAIPRGQTYQSFPMTREAVYKPITFDGRYFDSETLMSARRGISARYNSKIDNDDFLSSVKRADVVYIACDASPSGYHVQMRVLDWLKSLDANFVIKHFPVMSLVSSDLYHGLVNAREIDNLAEHAQLSLVRRHFDYNYLLNAYPIMGMTFEKAFGKRLAWPLSKHELQVLYFMRHGNSLTESDLFDVMKRWKGTGRYDTKGWDSYYGIGNSASRSDIMGNLKAQGLLDRAGKHSLVISSKGERLLRFLHPDCEDPDQVMRIYSWAQLPIEVAKEKVDRYIKTFFGKQKRFLSKVQMDSNMELENV